MEKRIAEFFTSLGAVILPMVILLAALVIDGAVLLFKSFPADIPFGIKLAACVLLGFAIAWSLLLTSVNSGLLKRWNTEWFSIGFPEVFGLCTVAMSLFFFDVWNLPAETHWSKPLLMVFLSVLFGVVEYLYCFIFVAKLREKHSEESFEKLYEQAHYDLQVALARVENSRQYIKELQEGVESTDKELSEYKRVLTCAHCGTVSASISTHRRHVGRCEKNPRNREEFLAKSVVRVNMIEANKLHAVPVRGDE